MPNTTLHSITFPNADPAIAPEVAGEFSTATNYAVKDYCTYQGILYRCTATHAAGAWNAAHFTATNIDAELDRKLEIPASQATAPSNPRVGDLWIDSDENSPIYNIDAQPSPGSTNAVSSGGTYAITHSIDNRKANKSIITGDYSASATYEVGALVMYEQQLYRCIVPITTPEAWNSIHWTATSIGTEIAILELDGGYVGEYIDVVCSYGESALATTQPSTWYESSSSLPFSGGDFIWQKADYTLHGTQTVISTEIKVIGYVGRNGTGSGTVTQITFNNVEFLEDGTGNVPITVNASDVGAIADPSTKANDQVLGWNGSAWSATTPVKTVNNVGITNNTTNIQLFGTAIPMSSSDNRSVQSAIPTQTSDLTNNSGFITASGAPVQSVDGGTGTVDTWTQRGLGTNPINGTSNDTVTKWTALKTGWAIYNSSGTIYGKPSTQGILFNIVGGPEIFQIWKAYPNGDIYWRSGTTNTTWTANSWIRLSDAPRIATITISASGWTDSGNDYYTATPTITGATIDNNSKIDLQPDTTAIQQMITDGVSSLYIANNNNTLTAYAIGAAPSTNMSIQATITEVTT